MRRVIFLIILVCQLSLTTHAQCDTGSTKDPQAQTTQPPPITKDVEVAFTGSWAGKARCDADGNVYLRLLNPESAQRGQRQDMVPIRKVSPNGKLAASFRVTDAADLAPDLGAVAFFAANDGRVYLAARAGSQRALYVLVFSNSGSLESKVKLDTEYFTPYQIGTFKNGNFLLSGIRGPSNRTPFSAIFSPKGELVKKVYEPEDEDARKRAEAGEANFRPDHMDYGNNFIVHGDVAIASDGNAYLLRAASPALVYVISPLGDLLRKIQIASPEFGLAAQSIKAAQGKLAISFLGNHSNLGVIQEVDLQGNPVSSFTSSDQRTYPGLLGCYGPNGFTFIGSDDQQRMHLYTSQLK
jgi:hypothetical protein